MYYELPYPLAMGVCGALAGFIGGGGNQIFPVWVGCVTGSAIGCGVCLFTMMTPPPRVEPIVIHNLYIAYVSGEPKDIREG